MLIADFERAAQSSTGSSCVLRGFAFLCLLTFSSSPWLLLSTLAVTPEQCSCSSVSSHFSDKDSPGKFSEVSSMAPDLLSQERSWWGKEGCCSCTQHPSSCTHSRTSHAGPVIPLKRPNPDQIPGLRRDDGTHQQAAH